MEARAPTHRYPPGPELQGSAMNLLSTSRRVFLLLSSGLFARKGFAQPAQADHQGLSAGEILGRMASVYATCATYQDSGCVTMAFVGGGARDRIEKRPFSTAFVRPSRFRFEFTEGRGHRFLAVADGAETRTWWDVQPGVKSDSSLELALAGATGISGGAAHTVPSLLMPDRVGGARLTELIELRRLEDAKLADADCFRIEGVRPFERDPERQELARQQVLKITGQDLGIPTYAPHVLWVERSTFLLRRIDDSVQHATYRTETTTTYEPRLDAAVAERQLAFDPPVR